jgi:hypothetical protein
VYQPQATTEELGEHWITHCPREAIFREFVDNARALNRRNLTARNRDEKRVTEEPRRRINDGLRVAEGTDDGHPTRL